MRHLAAVLTAIHYFALSACSSNDPQAVEDASDTTPIVDDLGDRDNLVLAGEPESGAATRCGVPNGVPGCAGETYASEAIPLDIYIMFDQSGSMCTCVDPGESQLCPDPACAETRLDAVRRATEQFLLDPESEGIGVGLGQFGKQPIGQASCMQSDYAAPAVDIGALPEHASAIMQALNRVEPTGETPTGAAIRGACDYAARHQSGAPGHQVVILLLTDGKPEAPVTCQNGQGSCCPSLSDAAAAAATCNDRNGIKTYVLGIGPLLDNLEQIAVAGGTERAYLVEGGDVSGKVLDALNRIRGAAIPCQLQLPQPPRGMMLALNQVNLEYQSSACDSTLFYSVASAAECGTQDGWYYDDPSNPGLVELCPASCERVTRRPGGSLFYSVGCSTQVR